MILTVTLNTALDRTVAVPRISLGLRHRATEARRAPGGKGVNVARALKALGEPVIATGLAGGTTGQRISELLEAEQVLHDFVTVEGLSRTNISIVDPTTGTQTEINERGPQVSAAELERFADRLDYLCKGASFCVFAGSLPPGAPPDIYAELIERVTARGVPALLDTDGEPMRRGLRAQPAIVVPNASEAEEAVGWEFSGAEEIAAGVRGLVEMGAEQAIITTANGAHAVLAEGHEKVAISASIPPLQTVAGAGSGDAFIAGYVKAQHAGAGASERLCYAVACGAESTQHLGAGMVDPAGVEALVGQVEVAELPVAEAIS